MFDSETFMKFIHLNTFPLLIHRNDLNLSLKEFIGHINSIAANDKPDLTLEDFFNLVASMTIENKLHLMLKDLIKVLSPVGLVKIMQAIPKNVTILDLNSNDLGESPIDKLAAIPEQ